MGITVITNNVPRNVIRADELTAKEREEFDYLDWQKIDAGEDGRDFIRYKGQIYDLNDTEAIPMNLEFRGWDLIVTETFFSGKLFKYVGEFGEDVICGRYYC
jgi:hypothetical protein